MKAGKVSETKFEDLKISNDFMFKEVMKSNKELCKRLVGSIMQQEIEDIVYIDTEKTDMRQFAFDTIQGITLPYWCDVKSPEEIIVKKVSGMIFGGFC